MSQETPRRPLVSGNWKMNLNHFEALKLVQELSYLVSTDDIDEVDISLHVPFTAIRTVQTTLEADKIPFILGAQDCHQETSGAFTGEISAAMLSKLNVASVLVGHSERREIFAETDELVNAKLKAVLAAEMQAIVCVGESLEVREAGQQAEFVSGQLKASLAKVKAEQFENIVIAYEPIWSIGTGQTASAEQAQEMCAHIRSEISESHSKDIADSLIIQYGGSVKPTNAAELLTQPDIDGALVGGASLDPASFSQIVQFRTHDLPDLSTTLN